MAAHPVHLLWAAPIAFGAGWAAQRASLCNVRAVADWLERRDSAMLAGLLQASLWATAGTGVLWLAGLALPVQAAPMGPVGALAGGLLFGLGAALNKGCSLSTLTRLAEGQWAMLLTLAGFALGARAAHDTVLRMAAVPIAESAGSSAFPGWSATGLWPLVPLVAWWFWRALRSAPKAQEVRSNPRWWRERSWSPRQVAWVFGLAGALMYGAFGAWTYTNLLRMEATGQRVPAFMWQLMLVACLVAGMVWSAQGSGRAALRGSAEDGLLRHLAGGLLMGIGSVAIPGGNDSVLLAWIPGLSLDGVVAYAGMVLGIAAPMLLQRSWRRA